MSKKTKIMQDPENRLSPLPQYLETYRDRIVNFGLFFQKFGKYQFADNKLETQHSWDNDKKGKEKENYEWSLVMNQFQHYQDHYRSINQILEKKQRLQTESLAFFKSIGSDRIELTAVALTRLLTGIGETTPTEVGMIFDRNTGLPFIPATTIKGVVRQAFCVNFARKNETEIPDNGEIDEKRIPGLIDIFGSLNTKNSTRGGFSFFDAYSSAPPELVMDIMNPHFGKYYQGEDAPVEIHEPIPIKFLSVEKGAEFKVRGVFLEKKAQEYREELIEAIKTAFCEIGIGAKTAVGYGRFEIGTKESSGDTHTNVTPQSLKVEMEIWECEVFWDKGKQTVSATFQGKKGSGRGHSMIAEEIFRVLDKKLKIKAKVTVEKQGPKYYVIKKVDKV